MNDTEFTDEQKLLVAVMFGACKYSVNEISGYTRKPRRAVRKLLRSLGFELPVKKRIDWNSPEIKRKLREKWTLYQLSLMLNCNINTVASHRRQLREEDAQRSDSRVK